MSIDMAAVTYILAKVPHLVRFVSRWTKVVYHAARGYVTAKRMVRIAKKQAKLVKAAGSRTERIHAASQALRELVGAKHYIVSPRPQVLMEYLQLDPEDPTLVLLTDKADLPAKLGKYDTVTYDPSYAFARQLEALLSSGLVDAVHAENPQMSAEARAELDKRRAHMPKAPGASANDDEDDGPDLSGMYL